MLSSEGEMNKCFAVRGGPMASRGSGAVLGLAAALEAGSGPMIPSCVKPCQPDYPTSLDLLERYSFPHIWAHRGSTIFHSSEGQLAPPCLVYSLSELLSLGVQVLPRRNRVGPQYTHRNPLIVSYTIRPVSRLDRHDTKILLIRLKLSVEPTCHAVRRSTHLGVISSATSLVRLIQTTSVDRLLIRAVLSQNNMHWIWLRPRQGRHLPASGG
jgi:hypothetical protein